MTAMLPTFRVSPALGGRVLLYDKEDLRLTMADWGDMQNHVGEPVPLWATPAVRGMCGLISDKWARATGSSR